jgi:ABC-type antimicrobial peptide transport system permease subunit
MKEIALRKVVGASPHHILVLINKGYFWVFIVATMVGCYGGWALSKLLLDMIFKINAGVRPGSVIVSAIVLFIIAAVTSGIKVWQAVRTNPVKLLRAE